jgi:hypothetical protein
VKLLGCSDPGCCNCVPVVIRTDICSFVCAEGPTADGPRTTKRRRIGVEMETWQKTTVRCSYTGNVHTQVHAHVKRFLKN